MNDLFIAEQNLTTELAPEYINALVVAASEYGDYLEDGDFPRTWSAT